MTNLEVVRKYGAGGPIKVKEAIFDLEEMRFGSLRSTKYYQNGEEEFYNDDTKYGILSFNEFYENAHAEYVEHVDKVFIAYCPASINDCENEGPVLLENPVIFISKDQDLNKTMKEGGNENRCYTNIEGKLQKPLITLDKKLYINVTFFRTNFPIARVYEIKDGVEIDPEKIYFEPKTIILEPNSNNITIRSEAHADIFDKLFDSRAWNYNETYKHKVFTEFAPQTKILNDFGIYRAD